MAPPDYFCPDPLLSLCRYVFHISTRVTASSTHPQRGGHYHDNVDLLTWCPPPPPPLKPRGDRVEWCEKQSSTLPLGGDHVDMV